VRSARRGVRSDQQVKNVPETIESGRAGLRHVTLFFSELVGLSELSSRVGELEASQAASRLLTLQEIIITRDGAGRVLQLSNDLIYAVFDNASVALNRALEVQRVLGAPRRATHLEVRLRVRVGLHTGEVLVKEGDHVEIISRHVTRARRVMEVAAPGQILVSEGVVDAARDLVDVPKEFVAIEYFGEFYLKGAGATGLCEVADLRFRKPEAPPVFETQSIESAVAGRLELAGYRPLERIGEGPFGVVYKAEEQATGKHVALKVLSSMLADNGLARQRFGREVARVRRMGVPGLAKVLDERLEHQPPFYVMEWVEGQPVDVALRGAAPERVAQVFLELCNVLEHAHTAGIFHGDLKPGNVLVPDKGAPVVMDFGIAAWQGDPQGGRTISTTFLGTPAYMAPEQIRGQPGRPETDVYAVGVLLFKVLAGREPFVGGSIHEVVQSHLHEDPPLPGAVEASVPDGLQRICLKALEKKPEDRYRTMGAMADDLKRCAQGETVRTRPSVYDNLLFHRVRQHVDQIGDWRQRGLLNPEEHNRLVGVYEGLERRGLPAVMEGRHYRFWQTLVYLGGWAVINGSLLWLVQHWTDLIRTSRLMLGSVPAITAFGLAVAMWELERFRLTFVALIVAVVAVPLMTGVWLHEFEVGASVPQERLSYELFHETQDSTAFTNLQLLLTTASALLAAAVVMQLTRTTTHSAQATLAVMACYAAGLVWAGLRLHLEAERWATIALQFAPLVLLLGGMGWILVSHTGRSYQASPWIYAAALLFTAVACVIPLYGIEEWELAEPTIRDPLSYLLLAGCGTVMVTAGLAARRGLGHRCRGATWLVILVGLTNVLLGLWLAGEPERWPEAWWRPTIFGAAVPGAHLVLPAVSLGIALLSCRYQMLSFLVTGLAGFAVSMHAMGYDYFAGSVTWPCLVMIVGAACLAVALAVDLRRTRGDALDDVISRSRL
jgi:serine/threonine protein kinase/class 3 adenylate cyclase